MPVTGWPLPGRWRAVDRARAVAHQYRAALHHTNPELCATIDRAATQAGETWITPTIITADLDDFVTVPEAAELVDRSVQWVYAWVAKNRTERMRRGTDGRIRVNVAAVQAAAAAPPR